MKQNIKILPFADNYERERQTKYMPMLKCLPCVADDSVRFFTIKPLTHTHSHSHFASAHKSNIIKNINQEREQKVRMKNKRYKRRKPQKRVGGEEKEVRTEGREGGEREYKKLWMNCMSFDS